MDAGAVPVDADIEPAQPAPVHSAPDPTALRLTCRRMVDADTGAAIALLCEGFPERTLAYWSQAVDRLRTRTAPEGLPRYGYVLAEADRLVGILLVIFAVTDDGRVRGNVSSWYVRPDYRGYSHILLSTPLKVKDVTLFNISPAPTTIPLIEAQGFARYAGGSHLVFAAVARRVPDVQVRRVEEGETREPLLADHARWGCLAFEVLQSGVVHPFAFVRQRALGGRVPCVQLAYCRDISDFARFAGPLGRCLLQMGFPLVVVDADRPLVGLRGIFRPGRARRYYRGAAKPRLGDLSYTELAIFGA